MELLELIKQMVSIKSEVDNFDKLSECLNFCENYFFDKNVFIQRTEHNDYPSLLISNQKSLELDVLSVGHIDVVPASNEMFSVTTEGDKMFGRGVADMKSYVAVGMQNLEYIVDNKIDMKYGILIVSDEETGGFNGSNHWVNNLGLKSKVVMDPDGGLCITDIIEKSKGVVIVKLTAIGKEVHGSKPWLGIDANEHLIQTINNIRKDFAYCSADNMPNDTWFSTVHIGTIKGGDASNKVSSHAEATLNFRITESETVKSIEEKVKAALSNYVSMEIIGSTETILVRNDDYLDKYRDCMSHRIGKTFLKNSDSASDGRFFHNKGMTLITHQANCGGLHAHDEWIDIKSLYDFKEIQLDYLRNFKNKKQF